MIKKTRYLFNWNKNFISYLQCGFETQRHSTGLEPVISHTENSWIASYYRQLSADSKMRNYKSNSSIVVELILPFLFYHLWKIVYEPVRYCNGYWLVSKPHRWGIFLLGQSGSGIRPIFSQFWNPKSVF